MESIEREIGGEAMVFLPGKAVYWKRRRTLMVADLHWGKAEIFQQAGVPVSSDMLQEDLETLRRLQKQQGAQRLLLLGDLIHGPRGMTEELQATVASWRESIPAEILLISGNHDRRFRWPASWQMDRCEGPYAEDVFVFSHHPEDRAGSYSWCGHLHPMIHIGDKMGRLRLPCFWLQKSCGILPSFGSFTGGLTIRPKTDDQILAVAEQKIFLLS